MQALRRATLLSRIVLIWFVMSLGVAVASPVIHPVPLDVICSATPGGGSTGNTGDQAPTGAHTLDCPLCASVMAPMAVPQLLLPTASPKSSEPVAVLTHPAARVAAPPLPSRGPPSLV